MAIDRSTTDNSTETKVAAGEQGNRVQVAQAATGQASDATARVIQVEPGQTIDLSSVDLTTATLVLQGEDLLITPAEGTPILLENFVTAAQSDNPPEIVLAEGVELAAGDIMAAAVAQSVPAAGPAAIAPAAGPGGGVGDNAGNNVTPNIEGPIGEGFAALGVLGRTGLSFSPPQTEINTSFIPEEPAPLTAELPPLDPCDAAAVAFDAAVQQYYADRPIPLVPETDATAIAIDEPGLLVGDFGESDDGSVYASLDVWRWVSGDGVTLETSFEGNTNDLLDGGDRTGDMTVVGDVYLEALSSDHASLYFGVWNAVSDVDGDEFREFNDHLIGGAGNDLMAGDILVAVGPSGSDSLDVSLDVSNFVGSSSGNFYNAFNDLLDGGAGDDTMVGDFAILHQGDSDEGETSVSIEVGNWIGAGDDNVFAAFSDRLLGGEGNDTIVGDGYFLQGPSSTMDIDIDVQNMVGFGYYGGYYGEGATYGASDDNYFYAFNDILEGGEGDDLMVGDFAFIDGGEASSPVEFDLYVTNYVLGDLFAEGGDGESSDNNRFTAFDDLLQGGDGNDLMVGDIYWESVTFSENEFDLNVDNFVWEGNDNSFSAFDDLLDGGAGMDALVGDLLLVTDTNSEVDWNINVWNAVSEGDGNSFSAFNDQLNGRAGDDILVGDIALVQESDQTALGISIENFAEGGEGNTFEAFNDVLLGGKEDDGDDVLVGDVMLLDPYGYGSTELEIDLSLHSQGGTAEVFNDHLCGFEGDDLLVGDVLGAAFAEGGDIRSSTFTDSEVSNIDPGVGRIALAAEIGRGEGYDYDYYYDYYYYGDDGSDGNSVNAFNDALHGSGGNDTVVGDVYAGNVDLLAGAGNGGTGEDGDDVYGYGGDGGNDNTLNAFNDVLTGSGGDDVLIGDVYGTGDGYDYWYGDDMGLFLAAAAGNAGEPGQGGSSSEPVDAAPGGAGGDGNTVNAFNDMLDGGAGDDLLVGDVYSSPGMYGEGVEAIDLTALAGIGGAGGSSNDGLDGGDDNAVSAFNDTLDGGAGNDTLVGDLYETNGYGNTVLAAAAGVGGRGGNGSSAESGGGGGDRNTVNAFNDVLTGGEGDDVLVGDVYSAQDYWSWQNIELTAAAGVGGAAGYEGSDGSGSDGGYGGDDNVVNAFNDTLDGGLGNDTLVGDVYRTTNDYGSGGIALRADAGGGAQGGESYSGGWGGDGGYGNTMDAFNDELDGGSGDDILVGDVYDMTAGGEDEQEGRLFGRGKYLSGGEISLAALAGVGGDMVYGNDGGDGGDGNTTRAFNDTLDGGNGADTVIGDVYVSGYGGAEIALTAAAGVGGDADWGSWGSGGYGGDNNVVNAFNDTLDGGQGDDTLVGDVFASWGTPFVSLTAEAGVGGYGGYYGEGGAYGGEGGDANLTNAFNDVLTGGDGDDTLVGDVYSMGGSGAYLSLSAGAGGGGEDGWEWGAEGGYGGDDNLTNAFNDVLTGGDGDDTLVGDVYADNAWSNLHLSVSAGFDGEGNTVTAFNDDLIGGEGNDILVGDAWLSGDSHLDVSVSGESGNTISAFQDSLDGGAGNDILYGDFYDGAGGFEADLDIGGDFEGRADLFADTLVGGEGDDILVGGLGGDDMWGGDGADTFIMFAGDASEVDDGIPFDEIFDFESTAQGGANDDVLNLADLLDDLGFDGGTDDINDWLRLTGNNLEVDTSGTGANSSFTDLVVLHGFNPTATITVDDMIADGNLIVV